MSFSGVLKTVLRQPRGLLNKIQLRKWTNWSGNINNKSIVTTKNPKTQEDLKQLVQLAKGSNQTIRVVGQGHSQSPAVVDSDSVDTMLIDLSCYRDLGENKDQPYIIDGSRVRVNAGIREDDLEVFLAKNNLTLPTVTAGGFFSIGGMTAVDVHGATVNSGIFAESVVEFDIMGPDGTIQTITEDTPTKDGSGKEIDFMRVNFGAFGVVTSVTIECMERNSVVGNQSTETITTAADFAEVFSQKTYDHQRVETFFNPYIDKNNYSIACWDVNTTSSNSSQLTATSACDLLPEKGAGIIRVHELAETHAAEAQLRNLAGHWTGVAMKHSTTFIEDSIKKNDLLWLTEDILHCIFMSYFIPIGKKDSDGKLNTDGLMKAWEAMDVVRQQNNNKDYGFKTVAPMEFRFVRGGRTVLSSTYSDDGDEDWFCNLDLIGYLNYYNPSNKSYTDVKDKLYKFFADVEEQWFNEFNGLPHHGKIFGFYNPQDKNGSPPFNPNFMTALNDRCSKQANAFNNLRIEKGGLELFSNDYIDSLVGKLPSQKEY